MAPGTKLFLTPRRVWSNGVAQEGAAVLVDGNRIVAVGTGMDPADATVIDLPGCTLLPGLSDLHSHLFLHPYNETSWDDQVQKESEAYRTVRAVRHAEATVMAGFTLLRDLGTEGAGYADVAVKRAIDEGLIPGPRLLVSTRAIVATGGYAPMRRNYRPDCCLAAGAEEASGVDEVVRAVRHQAAHGADWIKFYADYRVGPNGGTVPTFSIDELRAGVDAAHSLGRLVASHATGNEGMLRSILAGVDTIEHGYGGIQQTFQLMKLKGVAFLPTLMAAKSISLYRGEYKPGGGASAHMAQAANAFRLAREAGVAIGCGSDVGVFAHGTNRDELKSMAKLGMTPAEALGAATVVNARIIRRDHELGQVAKGFLADLVAVGEDPTENLDALDDVRLVMKDGAVACHRRP